MRWAAPPEGAALFNVSSPGMGCTMAEDDREGARQKRQFRNRRKASRISGHQAPCRHPETPRVQKTHFRAITTPVFSGPVFSGPVFSGAGLLGESGGGTRQISLGPAKKSPFIVDLPTRVSHRTPVPGAIRATSVAGVHGGNDSMPCVPFDIADHKYHVEPTENQGNVLEEAGCCLLFLTHLGLAV